MSDTSEIVMRELHRQLVEVKAERDEAVFLVRSVTRVPGYEWVERRDTFLAALDGE